MIDTFAQPHIASVCHSFHKSRVPRQIGTKNHGAVRAIDVNPQVQKAFYTHRFISTRVNNTDCSSARSYLLACAYYCTLALVANSAHHYPHQRCIYVAIFVLWLKSSLSIAYASVCHSFHKSRVSRQNGIKNYGALRASDVKPQVQKTLV